MINDPNTKMGFMIEPYVAPPPASIPQALTMAKDEKKLLQLLDHIQNHLDDENPPFNVEQVEQVLIRHLQHRDSAATVIAKILPILSAVWRSNPMNNDINGCLPSLIRLWQDHTVMVSETFSMLLRNDLLQDDDETTTTLMAEQFRAVAGANDDDTTVTTALLLFLQDIGKRPTFCLYDQAWEFVVRNGPQYPEETTRIVWDWALRVPDLLLSNVAIWDCLKACWNENAAAAMGNIVQQQASTTLYPEWLTGFLLHTFRTVLPTRRRVMRTLKCLVVDQNVRFESEELASVLVLGIQYGEDVPTQIMACQTAEGLIDMDPSVSSPVLEYSVVLCIEKAQTDKLLLAAMQLLTNIIQTSQWNRSAQCFANDAFFQQLDHFLQRNRQSHAPVVATLLQRLQQKTTKRSMDKLLCKHLSILSLMLSVKSTQRMMLGILNRMVKHYSKELAADENLLNALVILCMEDPVRKHHHESDGKLKESVKRLVLQLVPEL